MDEGISHSLRAETSPECLKLSAQVRNSQEKIIVECPRINLPPSNFFPIFNDLIINLISFVSVFLARFHVHQQKSDSQNARAFRWGGW